MKRRMAALTLAAVLALGLAACGGGSSEPAETEEITQDETVAEPLDLTGTYSDKADGNDVWFHVVVDESTIEVNWNFTSDNSSALYWAGSYQAPTDAADEYSWTSNADHSKTDGALFASSDDTKDFTYRDGKLSFDVTVDGATKTFYVVKEGAE